jgi:tetratricopeptide (TPR) repeat protein
MRRIGLLGFLIVLVLSRPAAVEARKNPHLLRGVRLLDQAEDEKALRAFKRALKWRGNRRGDLARIHIYLGITHLNLTDEESARRHFRQGLKLAPKIEVPDDVSPKIKQIVAEIREEIAGKSRPPTEPPTAAPSVTATPRPVTPVTPVVRRRQGGASPWSYWPAWVALSVGAAAGGTGLALGLMARSRADEANDLTLPTSDAKEKHDSAGTLALTANILFAAAGAAAILSGVLFYVGSGRRTDTATAEVVPLRGGALVQLRGVKW